MAAISTTPREGTRQTEQLRAFRTGFYDCLTGWPDAAFELCDAVLCATAPVSSVPTLSLEPTFRRSHGSLYKCLERGASTPTRCGRCWSPTARPDGRWCSPWTPPAGHAATPRPARSAASTTRASSTRPDSRSWPAGLISGSLSWTGRWTPGPRRSMRPVSARARTPPAPPSRRCAAWPTLLPADAGTPTFVFDAGYDPIALSHELAGDRVNIVVPSATTASSTPTRTQRAPGTNGRPRRHGQRFGCADDPASWPEPDQQLTAHDPRYGTVHVSAWSGLHPRLAHRGHWAAHEQAPIVTGTVVRVQVAAPAQGHRPRDQNPVAVVHRTRTARHRHHQHRLAGLPTPLRHRTHLPVREEHPGLDRPGAAHPRTGRPLDLADPRRLHPTTPGPRPGRRRPTALAATPSTGQTHTGTSPPRFSATTAEPRHTSQSTKNQNARARTAKRHPTATTNPLPSDQESSMIGSVKV